MDYKINLLEKKVENLKNIQKKKYFITLSVISLLTYCFITALIFAYWASVVSHAKSLEEQIKSKEKIIASQKITEERYLYYNDRLSNIKKILPGRIYPEKFLDQFLMYLPSGIAITSFEYGSANKTVSFSAKAADSAAVSEFIKATKDKNKIGAYLEKTEVLSLGRSKNPNYSFQVSSKLKK